MKKYMLIPLIVLVISIGITPVLAQEVLLKNINGTINSRNEATINWQFTNFDVAKCEQTNIQWNEGLGPRQNQNIGVNSTAQGVLKVQGWHVFDVIVSADCSNANATRSGPFDIIVNNTNKLGDLKQTSSFSSINKELSHMKIIDSLIKMNSELISSINKLVDLL